MKLVSLVCLLLTVEAWAGPSGTVPPAMPQKLSVGLFNNNGETWMKSSGVKWDYKYAYLTYQWSTNWGFGPRDGAFAQAFFQSADADGYMPAISYYEMNDIPPSNTGFYQKVQLPAAMAEYFADFKLLMQQAKTFGKPVLVMVEPDGYAYLQESAVLPTSPAAIASTGLPELASLPNTAAGWGLAFLQIRKSVGASNVVLGIHISGWATGLDIEYTSVTEPLQPAVDNVYAFLGPLGLTPNVTGDTYDVLVGDPLDRDSNYYKLVQGQNRWWDPSDSAPITSSSFNRYAEWMRLWNVKSSKRWVLWQVPIGNSLSKDICYNGSIGSGYKDNRTEYFFGDGGTAHLQKFVANGMISLLFGAGDGCQSRQEVDNNFLKTNVGAFYTKGGMLLPSNAPIPDAGTPVVDSGTPDAGMVCVCTCQAVDAGTPDAGVAVVDAGQPDSWTKDAGVVVVDAGAVLDPAQYNFESAGNLQGFTLTGGGGTLGTSTAKAFAGLRSLALTYNGSSSATQYLSTPNPTVPRGTTITYHVYIPAVSALTSLQVYAQEDASTAWKWNSNWFPQSALVVGWNTFTLTLPTAPGTLQTLGVQLQPSAALSGIIYVDSISWGAGAQTPDAGTAAPPPADAGSATKDAGTVAQDAGVVDAGAPVTGVMIKLMDLGDSITQEEWSWRCALTTTAIAAGYNIVPVGSQANVYDPCSPRHEGHPGWTIGDISAQVVGWLNTFQPDVVVVMAGTNDIAWWTTETGTSVADRQDVLITTIQQTLPNVKIVVQTIPPQSAVIVQPNNVDRAVLAQQYNTELRKLVAARVAAGQKVRLADINAVLTVADLRDGIHPNVGANCGQANNTCAGVIKMAPVELAALLQLLR